MRGQLVVTDEILAQRSGTHRQHYVVHRAVYRLAHRLYAIKLPGLRNKAPRTVHPGIDRGPRYIVPGHSQVAATPKKCATKPSQGTQHMCRAVELLFQRLCDREQLRLVRHYATRLSGTDGRQVALIGAHRHGQIRRYEIWVSRGYPLCQLHGRHPVYCGVVHF